MDRVEQGRSLLRRWEDDKPTNFYEADAHLRRVLALRMAAPRLAELEPALRRAGADAAGSVNRAAFLLDRPENLPRVEAWNGIGERTEDVLFHPLHHEVGHAVWRSGVLAVLGRPGGMTAHAALAYLFGQNGEVPHLCSVACTAGLVKAIQRSGSEAMRRDWLPRLVETDYDRRWHGAQFLTEVQGGSDVGANACTARPDGAGGWRISGEKWFCSNVAADLYAVTARPAAAPDGTAGIGFFVVPRRLPDGAPNGVFIRRLKNKLGTRTLPTAELDFRDAVAFPLGPLEDGFKLMMGVVINTSRLEVAVGACGTMRRAWVEAFHYARARRAFGHRLLDFPAVRALLAEMRVLSVAALSSTLFVAALEDRLALDGRCPEEDALFRTAVNVNKYVCSSDAGPVVHHAIEVLGGNGTIEDFSVLPRLYREVPVQESWEGPHNTLMAQVLRDAKRSKMHDALLGESETLLLRVQGGELGALREAALGAVEDVRGRLDRLLEGDGETAALHVRALVHRMGRLFQAAVLLEEAQSDLTLGRSSDLPAIARLFLDRYVVTGYEPMDDPDYGARLAAVLGE